MNPPDDRQVVFFGCPLDCDEKDDSIQEKLSVSKRAGETDDPYDRVMELIRNEVPESLFEERGSIDVPEWLRPKPLPGDSARVVVDEFVAFLDRDGCRTFASQVEDLVRERVLPMIPCMIAVDHSLTGGVVRAVSDRYGSENLSLIVLDSHTDAIPMSVMTGLIQYDLDTNPKSLHDPNDPFLSGRPESYNASSFLNDLLSSEVVLPENLYVVGISDFPQKRATRVKDPRVAAYVGIYSDLKKLGVQLITKSDCLVGPSKLKRILRQVETPYVYVSVDMDIGARNAVEGVRFRNWQGLQERQIYAAASAVMPLLEEGVRLAGMDVVEFNPRRAGEPTADGDTDRTYRIAANLIKKVAFAMESPL